MRIVQIRSELKLIIPTKTESLTTTRNSAMAVTNNPATGLAKFYPALNNSIVGLDQVHIIEI